MVASIPKSRRPRPECEAASRPTPQTYVATRESGSSLAAQESQILRLCHRLVDSAASGPSHRTQVWHRLSSTLPQLLVGRTPHHTTKTATKGSRAQRRSHRTVEEKRLAAHSKRARRQRAHLVFIDECGLMMLPLLRRTLAPRGKTPIFLSPAGHRHKVSMIAALCLSPRGRHLGLYFSSLIDGSYDGFTVAWFLRELLRHLRGRVIVVWDRGQMHRGPEIEQLLEKFPRLTLEQLPAYAPDLNPVEHLWNYLKWQQLPNFAPRDVQHLEQTAFERLHAIRYNNQKLLSFFDAADLPFPTRALAS